MAKDDYDVIVYRTLVYYYACLKGKIMFEEETFKAAVRKNVESDEYFANILEMMQEEGLIKGIVFTKAWGNVCIPISDLQDIKITAHGIRYLKDNSEMKMIGDKLKEAVDIISKLAIRIL